MEEYYEGSNNGSYTRVYERQGYNVWLHRFEIQEEINGWVENEFGEYIDETVVELQNLFYYDPSEFYPLKLISSFSYSETELFKEEDCATIVELNYDAGKLVDVGYMDWFPLKMDIKSYSNHITSQPL
jgi:hypothetical protein